MPEDKYDFDNVIFDNRDKADLVLLRMNEIVNKYGYTTVADLYDLVGATNNSYVDDKYGWTDLHTARVDRVRDGYMIKFPSILSIDYNYCNVINRERCACLPVEKYLPLDESCKKEMVNHPDHYQSENGLEVIDVIEAFTKDLHGVEAWDTGNIIKYGCRWPRKNGIEDLKKVVWYAQHLIKHLENKGEK